MAKQKLPSQILLRWSDHVPESDVMDPLGLGLRGSARLGSRLLFCITSITPRARYFSFLPWTVYDYQKQELGKSYALGLRDAIVLREQAFTLGCVAHHEGKSCAGGALVGSEQAAKWYEKNENQADFRKIKKFAKNPALGAYFNSIVNLGFFITDDERQVTDEEEENPDPSFDGLELSPLGLELAKQYESAVGAVAATKHIGAKHRTSSVNGLAEWGKYGGLCELANTPSPDRELLCDIFFAKVDPKEGSHEFRRRSLLLILAVCEIISADEWILNEPAFESVVYYGEIANEADRQAIHIPKQLNDIATRWRMFYFHHYMSVALEGLFSWLVSNLGENGLAGSTLEALAARLDEASVGKQLSEVLEVNLKGSFGKQSPSKLFSTLGLSGDDLDVSLSKAIDKKVRSLAPFSEDSLESMIRDKTYLYSSTGLALPLILLVTTLARYKQWDSTNYGEWLANVASDPYLDLIPPIVSRGLTRHFGNWWACSWKEFAVFVLSRYVVQQHQSLSYEKTWVGDRCLIQVDGPRVISKGNYEKIGMGNPRLRSAIQILKDLSLIEDDSEQVTRLTMEGKKYLQQEMARESKNEVS